MKFIKLAALALLTTLTCASVTSCVVAPPPGYGHQSRPQSRMIPAYRENRGETPFVASIREIQDTHYNTGYRDDNYSNRYADDNYADNNRYAGNSYTSSRYAEPYNNTYRSNSRSNRYSNSNNNNSDNDEYSSRYTAPIKRRPTSRITLANCRDTSRDGYRSSPGMSYTGHPYPDRAAQARHNAKILSQGQLESYAGN